MIKFKYCGTHLEDEEYMNKMSKQGWNTKSLVEGFWNFEKGQKNEYAYRIYYFRGMNKQDINKKIKELKSKNIEFVNKYSFWGIFKSKKDFKLYTDEEQLELCKKIRNPMQIAMITCPVLIIVLIILTITIHKAFLILLILLIIYYLVCLYLTISYTKLINKIRKN